MYNSVSLTKNVETQNSLGKEIEIGTYLKELKIHNDKVHKYLQTKKTRLESATADLNQNRLRQVESSGVKMFTGQTRSIEIQ